MIPEKKSKVEKLKEEYSKLQKKYSLPNFEDLDEEFEIKKIEADSFIIREIRRDMTFKLQAISDLLEPILNPSARELHSFIELKVFEKKEIEDTYNFYKKLWALIHKGIVASLETEQKEVDFIKELWKAWPEIKKQAHKFAAKITEAWQQDETETFVSKYVS